MQHDYYAPKSIRYKCINLYIWRTHLKLQLMTDNSDEFTDFDNYDKFHDTKDFEKFDNSDNFD